MNLYHFSEEPDIREFVLRRIPSEPRHSAQGDAVPLAVG